jgi:hypothetical protein
MHRRVRVVEDLKGLVGVNDELLDVGLESPLGGRAGLTFSDRGARIVALITSGRLGGRAASQTEASARWLTTRSTSWQAVYALLP